jgi:hypothetical protein
MNTEEQIEQARQQLISEDISSFPSLFQQSSNLAKQVWVSGTASVLQGKPLLASADKAYARLQICQGCEFFRDNRCLKCGCFMEKKTHVDAAACPVNKWGPELQVMLTEEQMKTPPPQPKIESIPPMKAIDLSTYPENEQVELRKLAEESVTHYDGRFAYSGAQYYARLAPPPKAKRTTIVDHLTPAERDELNSLAKQKLQQANNEPTIFSFKDVEFQVLPLSNNRGIRIALAPGSPGIPVQPST